MAKVQVTIEFDYNPKPEHYELETADPTLEQMFAFDKAIFFSDEAAVGYTLAEELTTGPKIIDVKLTQE